jgi:predicted AAA+ superfamily ATPase
LRLLRERDLIKVVVGVRRAGKSTLLRQFQRELLVEGVNPNQIVGYNFEDPAHRNIRSWEKLYDEIDVKLVPDKMNYVFLDEVQLVPDFQKAVDGLHIKTNVDLYITGSNAYLLSGELATLLSGRYIKIDVFPFSFFEYVQAFPDENPNGLYRNYSLFGGFPQAARLLQSARSEISDYLRGVYDTIVVKDIAHRRKFSDLSKFHSVAEFVLSNIGNITTPKKIADTMTSIGRNISNHTVESFIDALTDSYVIFPAKRFDIRGKKLLQTREKFYCVDAGLRNIVTNSMEGADEGFILENIIYLELLKRYNNVWIGKVGEFEVDFVTQNIGGEFAFYQVAAHVSEQQTLDREIRSLNKVRHHGDKHLITLDPARSIIDGIRRHYAVDWLLNQ